MPSIAPRSVRLAALVGAVAALSVGLGMGSLWAAGFPIGFNPLIGTAGLVGVEDHERDAEVSGHPFQGLAIRPGLGMFPIQHARHQKQAMLPDGGRASASSPWIWPRGSRRSCAAIRTTPTAWNWAS